MAPQATHDHVTPMGQWPPHRPWPPLLSYAPRSRLPPRLALKACAHLALLVAAPQVRLGLIEPKLVVAEIDDDAVLGKLPVIRELQVILYCM